VTPAAEALDYERLHAHIFLQWVPLTSPEWVIGEGAAGTAPSIRLKA